MYVCVFVMVALLRIPGLLRMLLACLAGAIQIDFVCLPVWLSANTNTHSVHRYVCLYLCAEALCFDNAPNCRPTHRKRRLQAISGLFACLPLGPVTASSSPPKMLLNGLCKLPK